MRPRDQGDSEIALRGRIVGVDYREQTDTATRRQLRRDGFIDPNRRIAVGQSATVVVVEVKRRESRGRRHFKARGRERVGIVTGVTNPKDPRDPFAWRDRIRRDSFIRRDSQRRHRRDSDGDGWRDRAEAFARFVLVSRLGASGNDGAGADRVIKDARVGRRSQQDRYQARDNRKCFERRFHWLNWRKAVLLKVEKLQSVKARTLTLVCVTIHSQTEVCATWQVAVS